MVSLAQALTSGLQTHLTKGICTYLHTHKTANLARSLPRSSVNYFVIPISNYDFTRKFPILIACRISNYLVVIVSDLVADSSDCQVLSPSTTRITCSRILLNPTGFPNRTYQLFNHSQSIRISSSALRTRMHARVSRCPSADCLSQRRLHVPAPPVNPARRRACIPRVRDPRTAAHAFRASEIPRGPARASRVSQLDAAQLTPSIH